jgi:hypothetical protein
MTPVLIISNILSVIGVGFNVFALFKKEKSKVLIWQSVAFLFMAAADITVGAIVAAAIMPVNIIKNILDTKGKLKWSLVSLFTVLYIAACIFTYKQPIDLIPVIASIQYLFFVKLSKTLTGLKAGVAINAALWAVSDAYFVLIPLFIGDFTLISTSLINIIKDRKEDKKINENIET